MARYIARYEMGGVRTGTIMDWLQPGDEITLVSAFGKKINVKVKNTYNYDNRKVYITDRFGLIYADELASVHVPAWNKKPAAKAEAKVV
jgi:hypothetical protein